MRKFFSQTRKFEGKQYDLVYQAGSKAEAKGFIAKYVKGRKARVISATMMGGRRVYLVYAGGAK